MKKILITIIGMILFVPSVVFAQTESMNLVETLKSKNIEIANKDYKETDDQVTLYLFRWDSCSHCLELMEFLNSISTEYGAKFKLRSYETTTNKDNDELRQNVADYFGVTGTGVPLLIIGESSFYGFQESNKEQIKEAIDSEYAKSERFDIIETLDRIAQEKNPNDALYIIVPIGAAIVIGVLVNKARKEK